MLKGTLLAESLALGSAFEVEGLQVGRIVRRDVSSSAAEAQPQVWTFIEFHAEDDVAYELAEALSNALRADGGWCGDFTNRGEHFVVFARRMFRYRMGDATARAEVEAYGRSVGVPENQLDWGDN
jgi:hypothetical protein